LDCPRILYLNAVRVSLLIVILRVSVKVSVNICTFIILALGLVAVM